MPTHDKGDVPLAIGLTFAAGLSTVIGASFAFCVTPEYVEILPISLAFSAGVMIYVSFVEIMSEALLSFEEELHGQNNHVFLAHLYTSATFFGGIAFGYLLDYIVHALGYSHNHINQQPEPEGAAQCEFPHHHVPNATHSDQLGQLESPQSPQSKESIQSNQSGQIKLSELNQVHPLYIQKVI